MQTGAILGPPPAAFPLPALLAIASPPGTAAEVLPPARCYGTKEGGDVPPPPPDAPGDAPPGGTSTPPGGSPEGVNPFAARVWTVENVVSSYGATRVVQLGGLPVGARELSGEWIRIVGRERLDGNFLHPPFTTQNSLLTDDRFDQVQCYYAITSLLLYLNGLGFDMAKVIAALKPIVANVNTVDDLNAWFDTVTGQLTFGAAKGSRFGEWHLAGDHDIDRHELGHLILFCLNRALTDWSARDGGAIHEGFGDAIAALFIDDAELGEDLVANVARNYGTKEGLRTLEHALRYGETNSEVHELGKVYGGFWWGVRKALEPLIGNGRTAADLTLAFLVNHGAHYTTTRPGPADFLDAALVGARTYLEGQTRFGVKYEDVDRIMKAEAAGRNMVSLNTQIPDERRPAGSNYLAHLLADHGSRFAFVLDPTSATRGTFGLRDWLQQYLVLEGQLVSMLGSGLILFRGRDEDIQSFSARDVRLTPRVNPGLSISREVALQRVKEEAARQLEASTRALESAAVAGPASSDADERAKLAMIDWAKIQRRADEIAYQAAEKLTDPSVAELVVMPEGYEDASGGGGDLHWRVRLPASREVFVNARTGRPAVQKMPMW